MKIFLDIDGVMVHANPRKQLEFENDGFYKFNQAAIDTLHGILNSSSSNEIILSTSHRFRYSISEWKSIFRRRGLHINRISRISKSLNSSHSRKVEIMEWIHEKNLERKEFMIIDDDKSLNGLPVHIKKHLILTNPYVGLNSSIIQEKGFIIKF